MSIGAHLQAVMDLQPEWTDVNTPAMQERGQLIRRQIPISLRPLDLSSEIGLDSAEIGVEGRDGTGRKSAIPWVRIHARAHSPSATTGWYLVFLFSQDGRRLYLSLNQGTTRWVPPEFVSRRPEELAARVSWARDELGLNGGPDQIDLGSGQLARQYARGNVTAVAYDSGAVPNDEVIEADLRTMAQLLGALYRAQDAESAPGDEAPEIVTARHVAGFAAGKRAAMSGQGFRLNADERSAVELRAMAVAREHLEELGWVMEDVSGHSSFDYSATKDGRVLAVEVKGTTGDGATVILTGNELRLHRERYPDNALAVVSNIELHDRNTSPWATGGTLALSLPWLLPEDGVKVLSAEVTL